ncbi:unnamed protein product [Withania somnifera]
MASSIVIVLHIPILVLVFLFITCSFVAPAPEIWTIDFYDSISFNNKLHLECDLNVDVDLPRPGGNYVLSCFKDYGAGKYYGDSWVLFDYQRDKSRCANKRCSWHINENGAFLLLRFHEWGEQQ